MSDDAPTHTVINGKQPRRASVVARSAQVAERHARLERMRSEFRAAQQRRLVERGIALWNQSEATYRAAYAQRLAGDDDESD